MTAAPVADGLLAQIAPQRSTQYANLAATLAPIELQLSGLIVPATALQTIAIAGQPYLELPGDALKTDGPIAQAIQAIGPQAFSGPFFEKFETLCGLSGPFLRPVEATFSPPLPPELAQTRRYRGKTNEQFTHFLCNIARYSSHFRAQPWPQLRLFDPLAGGGTTLFTGLFLGASVAGVEQDEQDVKSTVAYIRQFMREERIRIQVQEETLRKLPGIQNGRGRRWTFSLGPKPGQTCILAQGDTRHAGALVPGFRPHLIITDLPYGIQHQGPLIELLTQALPVWQEQLLGGGVLAFSWDATRFPRAEMVERIESVSRLTVLKTPPYTALAHPIDRVIKQRDVLVAQRA